MSGPVFEVFTLFPEAISGFLRGGLVGKAVAEGKVRVHCTDYREFATDRYRTVDDTPYGGGPGMVMKVEPVVAALEAVTAARGPMHRVLLTPSAPRFDQAAARRQAHKPRIALLCGRYEGIDDRVREAFADECLSLGDFVLNGGEVAALAIVEAVARLCEGVLGNPESAARDSFAEPTADDAGAWLEFPQYTRPPVFRGLAVPGVLLGGNHADVARWRALQAWRRTWAVRPELRPRPSLPADAEIYLALTAGDDADLDALRVRPDVAGVYQLGPRARGRTVRDVKELRRELRRRHGREPQLVAVAADPVDGGELPVAHSAAALLDLLGLSGDLSAPLVLLPVPDPPRRGDLTSSADGPRAWPTGVCAVLALDPAAVAAASRGLAGSPPMIDSSPPQPVCGSALPLTAAALSELRPSGTLTAQDPVEPRHEQPQPVHRED